MSPKKWQTLLQPDHSSCQPLLSDDASYCFISGVPLSIHTYLTSDSTLISSYTFPDCDSDDRFVSIHRHPFRPQAEIVLVSSAGLIYIFNFLDNRVLATYRTRFSISFSAIRPPCTLISEPPSSVPRALTIIAVTEKTAKIRYSDGKPRFSGDLPASEMAKDHESKIHYSVISVVYAIELSLPSRDDPNAFESPKGISRLLSLLKTPKATQFAASACGSWFGVVASHHIWVIRLTRSNLFGDLKSSKDALFQTIHLSAPEPLTCIAFPPKVHADHYSLPESSTIDLTCTPGDSFATGSVTGRIALWHALSEAQWATFVGITKSNQNALLRCPTSVSQWHAHSVADLTFTRNGSHLLSGGEEAVLVLWRLEDFSGIGVDSKSFLPRLPGPISRISLVDHLDTNEPGALVTAIDGTLLLVNTASMSLYKSLLLPRMRKLPLAYKTSASILVPLVPLENQPTKLYGNLLLKSSHPTGLQVVDGVTGALIWEFFVTPKNTISRRDERPIVEPKLEYVAVGGELAQFMGTLETWVDVERDFEPEVNLKIWERSGNDSYSYKLIGQVDSPHEATITSLTVSPGKIPLVVTTASDGAIKIWTSKSFTSSCDFEWQHAIKMSYRGLEAYGTAFSEDSTIMAAVHAGCITLWDMINYKFLRILASGSKSRLGRFKQVSFVGTLMDKLLLVGSIGLATFDLVSGTELRFWSYETRAVLAVPATNRILLFQRQKFSEVQKSIGAQDKQSFDQVVVVDINQPTEILITPIRPAWSAAFVGRTRNQERRFSCLEDEVFDGLVLLTETAGLLRYGESQSVSSDKMTILERRIGIRSSLPFDDLLSIPRDSQSEALNIGKLNLQQSSDPSNLQETDDLLQTIIDMAPHLVPPARLLWSTLIQPRPMTASKQQEPKTTDNQTEPVLGYQTTSHLTDQSKLSRVQRYNGLLLPADDIQPLTERELTNHKL